MNGFTKRELLIIGATYHDCERIALERVVEQRRCGSSIGEKMARQLAHLFIVRKEQIQKYKCDLPRKRRRIDMAHQ